MTGSRMGWGNIGFNTGVAEAEVEVLGRKESQNAWISVVQGFDDGAEGIINHPSSRPSLASLSRPTTFYPVLFLFLSPLLVACEQEFHLPPG